MWPEMLPTYKLLLIPVSWPLRPFKGQGGREAQPPAPLLASQSSELQPPAAPLPRWGAPGLQGLLGHHLGPGQQQLCLILGRRQGHGSLQEQEPLQPLGWLSSVPERSRAGRGLRAGPLYRLWRWPLG